MRFSSREGMGGKMMWATADTVWGSILEGTRIVLFGPIQLVMGVLSCEREVASA